MKRIGLLTGLALASLCCFAQNGNNYPIYRGSQIYSAVTVTTAPTLSLPFSSDAKVTVTDFFIALDQNITISSVTGPFVAGSEIVLTFHQNAPGNFTVSFPASFLNVPTVQSGSGLDTAMAFQYCGSAGNGNACPAGDWQNTDIGPAGGTLSSLTAATVANTLANGNFPQTWNWAQTTDSQNAFTFGETSAATSGTLTNAFGNQAELKASTASASTAAPLSVVQGGITAGTGPPAAQIQTTWNNAGLVGEGILFNATDTASATSLMLDMRVGNTFKFKVDKTGLATAAGGFTSSGSTAGVIDFAQGASNSGAAPCTTANSRCEQVGTSVTSFVMTKTGSAPTNNNSAELFSNAAPAVGAWAKMQQTAITSGTAYSNATTTFSSVVGSSGQTLQFSVEANTNYVLDCQILWQASAATAGPKFQFTGPASPTAVQYAVTQAVTATSDGTAGATAFSTSLNASGATVVATTNEPAELSLGLVNGANAGTVTLQAAAQGAGTLTINPGSFCRLQ